MENIKKFLTRRNIFMALGVVIALEIIWAGFTLLKPTPPVEPPPALSQTSTISLQSSQTNFKVGEKITVEINLSSGKKVDGADILINYDPKILSAKPVTAGGVFSDFPTNKVDENLGRITVSGITDKSGGVLANGLLGSVEFTAKASGATQISLEFTLGSTSDSNLTESGTGKDILEEVSDLELTILP